MTRKRKFLIGGVVIAAALAYLIYAGVSQSVVYFVTPSELGAAPVAGKTYRLGGMVLPGTLKWDARSLDLRFTLSDGQASVPVRHRGPETVPQVALTHRPSDARAPASRLAPQTCRGTSANQCLAG